MLNSKIIYLMIFFATLLSFSLSSFGEEGISDLSESSGTFSDPAPTTDSVPAQESQGSFEEPYYEEPESLLPKRGGTNEEMAPSEMVEPQLEPYISEEQQYGGEAFGGEMAPEYMEPPAESSESYDYPDAPDVGEYYQE